jgi:tellurite resistance protein
MTTPVSDETELRGEAIKLLVQVASSNHEVHDKERAFLLRLATTWNVLPVLEGALAALDGGRPLPQPRLQLLRAEAERVLRAAEVLVAVDGEVDQDETEMLREVRALLGRPPA